MNGSGSGPESRSTEQALGTIADETNVLSKQMQKGTLINRISILDILLSGQDNCTCGAPSYLWVIESFSTAVFDRMIVDKIMKTLLYSRFKMILSTMILSKLSTNVSPSFFLRSTALFRGKNP